MDNRHLKLLLDSCFTARQIVETLPEIPKGMKPRHMHVLEAVRTVSYEKGCCRVSDISSELNVTTPSISKLICELEEMGMLKKFADKNDKRVTCIVLTTEGKTCVKKYVTDFHEKWAGNLRDITNQQAEQTALTISRLMESMPGKETKNEQ